MQISGAAFFPAADMHQQADTIIPPINQRHGLRI